MTNLMLPHIHFGFFPEDVPQYLCLLGGGFIELGD